MSTTITIKVERIYPFKTDGPLRAFCDIVINDALLIKGLKVLQGQAGVFVAMPQEKGKDDKWWDSVRCLTPEVRKVINQEVISAYNAHVMVNG